VFATSLSAHAAQNPGQRDASASKARMKPVRVGMVGAGRIVEKMHLPILRSMRGVEVAWVYDQNPERVRTVAAAFDVQLGVGSLAECSPVDIVLVAIPVGARRTALTDILPRGWHAFCEKPFAPTVEDHKWMLAEARRCGVRLGVGLMRRYYESTGNARRLLESGTLGRVELIVAGEGQRVGRTGRGADWYQASARASGGGVLFEHGSHLIDQVFTICGVEDYGIAQCSRQVVGDLEFETSVQGTFSLASGDDARFAIVVTRLHDVYNGIVIRCENGEIRVPTEPGGVMELFGTNGMSIGRVGTPIDRDRAWVLAFQDQWKAFIAACSLSSEFSDRDTGLVTTSFLEACTRIDVAGSTPARVPSPNRCGRVPHGAG